MRCEELLRGPAEYLGPTDSVRFAAGRMRDLNIGFLPVCIDGRVEGVVTDRDLALRVLAEGRAFETEVREVMSTNVVACAPDDDLREVERLMREAQIQRIVVSDDDDRLLGVVSLADLALAEEPSELASTVAHISDREAVPPP